MGFCACMCVFVRVLQINQKPQNKEFPKEVVFMKTISVNEGLPCESLIMLCNSLIVVLAAFLSSEPLCAW